MDGYAPIGADPEEEQVPEEAGHGLPRPEPRVHTQVEPVVKLLGEAAARQGCQFITVKSLTVVYGLVK